jgi:membrane-associated phospholipid phosphatase
MAPPPDRAIPRPTLLGVGALFLLAFLALTTAVTQERLDGMDQMARAFVHRDQGPRLSILMEATSAVGGQPGQLAVVGLGSMILWRRRPAWALTLPLAMAGVGIVQFVAKGAIDRPRPNLHPWGFPSAHVLSLVVLGGLLAYMVGRTRGGRRWQPLAVGIAGGIVSVVAYSRLYLDAHWLSDILGGVTAGLAYVLILIWLIETAPALQRGLARASRTRGSDGLGVPVTEPLTVPVAATVAPASLSAP